MAFFTYVGRDAQGVRVEGALEGASSGAIADQLMATGVIPVDITESAPPAKDLLASFQKRLAADRIGPTDLMLFSRQMHTLMKAGVPIMQALAGLQESSVNPAFKDVIRDLRESLDSGRELSQALAAHPKIFNAFYVSMVRVGESTGRLEEVYIRLFQHIEFQTFMRDQVKSALRYPSFVMIAMVVAMVIINIFVIPAFAKVFKGFNAELPIMTRVLIGFSDWTLAWWPVLVVAGVAAVFGFRVLLANKRGRYHWDRAKLRFPIAGNIVKRATLARLARSLSLGLRSGVPIVQAMTLTAQTVENDFIAARLDEMRTGIERGESILRTAVKSKVFTPVVLQMIMVGEESGALDEMMEEIAAMYQREVEYDLKSLSAQIEPILITFLGAMVLVLALGVFLPLWDLGKTMIK